MKIVNVNCGVKNYMKEDHRSYIRNFCGCGKKPEKKIHNFDIIILSRVYNEPIQRPSPSWLATTPDKTG